jgi:hypothetical protein
MVKIRKTNIQTYNSRNISINMGRFTYIYSSVETYPVLYTADCTVFPGSTPDELYKLKVCEEFLFP